MHRPIPIADSPAADIAARRVIYTVRGRPGPLDRPALPPGHPDSWGAITAGTLLDHAKYPFPIFTRGPAGR